MKSKLEDCLRSLDELEAKLNDVLSSMDEPARFRIDEALLRFWIREIGSRPVARATDSSVGCSRGMVPMNNVEVLYDILDGSMLNLRYTAHSRQKRFE